jgi:hypothetical protein
MMHRSGALALVLAVGCGGDEKIAGEDADAGGYEFPDSDPSDTDDTDDTDDSPDSSACSEDADCERGQICEDDECVAGDRNGDFESADNLRFIDGSDEDEYTYGVINPVGDKDYYAFEADGGEFIRINTYTDEEDDTKDTVVSVFRDNGKRLTYANGHAAGGGLGSTDSAVYAYIPEAGTYYVLVEDDGTFFEDGEPEGGADYNYGLALTEWSSHTAESDSASAPSAFITLSADRSWYARGVVLETPGDIDYIGLDVEIDGYDLYLDGNYDLEGSEADPRVRLIDVSTGEVLRDKRQNGLPGSLWYPRLPLGEYLIEVSDFDGGGSAEHWFYVHAIARESDSTYEWEMESNDTVSSAQVMTQDPMETSSGSAYSVSRVEGLADSTGEEDWFEVSSDYEDGRIVVCLNSTWYGATSAPDIELYDASGTLLGEVAGETDSAVYPTATIANVSAPSGSYYVRVKHPADQGGTPGDWYRMLVYVASFEVTNYDCP